MTRKSSIAILKKAWRLSNVSPFFRLFGSPPRSLNSLFHIDQRPRAYISREFSPEYIYIYINVLFCFFDCVPFNRIATNIYEHIMRQSCGRFFFFFFWGGVRCIQMWSSPPADNFSMNIPIMNLNSHQTNSNLHARRHPIRAIGVNLPHMYKTLQTPRATPDSQIKSKSTFAGPEATPLGRNQTKCRILPDHLFYNVKNTKSCLCPSSSDVPMQNPAGPTFRGQGCNIRGKFPCCLYTCDRPRFQPSVVRHHLYFVVPPT